MDSLYPNAIDGYSQLPLIVDGVTTIDAGNINAMRSAIVNIESELGTTPRGEFGSVKDRLDELDSLLNAVEEDVQKITSPMANGLIKATDTSGKLVTGTNIIVDNNGKTTFPDNIIVQGGIVAQGNPSIVKNLRIEEELEVDSTTTLKSDLIVRGASTLSTTTITGALSILGAVTFVDITASGALTVGGLATFNGGATVGTSFTSTAAATFDSTISVTGTSTFSDSITANLATNDKSFFLNGGTFAMTGRRNYGGQTAAPTSPYPAASNGDTYFDTTIMEEMYYDNAKSKWLSVATYSIPFGRNNTVAKGGFFRGIDGKAMSSTIGEVAIRDGTVVHITLTRDAPASLPSSIRYTVFKGGTVLVETTLTTAATSTVFATNSDFNANDILSVGINSASTDDSTTGTMGKIYYKWRR